MTLKMFIFNLINVGLLLVLRLLVDGWVSDNMLLLYCIEKDFVESV